MAFALKYFVMFLLLSMVTQGNVIESLKTFCIYACVLVHISNLISSHHHGMLNPFFFFVDASVLWIILYEIHDLK